VENNLSITAPTSQVIATGPSASPSATPAQLARLAKAKDVAQKFEAVFLQQMMQMSSQDVDKNDPMGGGFGEQMYRQMLNEQTANALAAHGGLGLANTILKQMAQRGDIPPLQNPAQAAQSYKGVQ
jgi:Rod binding domain-containing protein